MTIRVAYVTTNRSDYGPAHCLLQDLLRDARFELQLLVGGAHLSAAATVGEIEADGLPIGARIPFPDGGYTDASAGALTGFAAAFRDLEPDVALIYGDRWELLPIANAAMLVGVPLAHLCGGDITEGALDNQVRHAITKIAHVHFASSARSAERILQMGEEPWRVHDVGDPSLDRFRRGRAADPAELEQLLGFRPDRQTLLVTFHPATLTLESLPAQVSALAAALRAHRGTVVITAPAPDPGSDIVRTELESLARERPRTAFVESLGSVRYRGLMGMVGAMVGNSSSGLSEAPCVPLPVVNVGDRQAGRDRARNVIDVPAEEQAITRAIARALAPEFRDGLAGIVSPYGDGRSAERIVEVLAALPPRAQLLRKQFVETVPVSGHGLAPIGGDFALDPQWLYASEGDWFAAARDALAAIAAVRPGRWLVPDYLCPVVPETLAASGGTVEPYAWRTPWEVDEADLARRLDGAAGVVVPFHMGLPPADTIWRALDRGQVCVVEDRCHCVGAPPPADRLRGDFAIGSLRKWMPVPDGAWCVTRRGDQVRPSGAPAREMVRLRAAAGLVRATWLSRGAVDGTLERAAVDLFARGEAAAGEARADRRGSLFAARAVGEVDLAEVARRRIGNQRALAARVARATSVELWQPTPAAIEKTDVPLLALPLLCRDRDALRARLAAHRIFCAVHWIDGDWSRSGGRPAEWAARSLSLPIDQRLGPAEMDRIAEVIEG